MLLNSSDRRQGEHPLKLALIVGDGYSGSTLLDLILGSHGRAIGLGEIQMFDRFIERKELCTCLQMAHDCPFWSDVLSRIKRFTRNESFKVVTEGAQRREALQNTEILFTAIQSVSSAEVLVDSSKRYQRARALSEFAPIEPRIIHLVRDGRGVAYSHIKRGESFYDAVLYWKKTNLEIQEWLQESSSPPSIRIKYEDLCTDTFGTVQRLCDFLTLDWRAEMLDLWRHRPAHNIGGNLLRFARDSRSIRADEQWRQALCASQLRLFEQVAGEARRRLDYE